MKAPTWHDIHINWWGEVPRALAEMIQDIEGRVLPAHGVATSWDYVRVELWPDSGRFIAFPAHSENEVRVDITGCQIICREIERDLCSMDESDLSDEEFERHSNHIIEKMLSLAIPYFDGLRCKYRIVDSDEANNRRL